MAVNAITTSGAQVLPQIGILSSIVRLVQNILDLAGVESPDALFNILSQQTSSPPGLAAAPYVDALRNTSVSVLVHLSWQFSPVKLCIQHAAYAGITAPIYLLPFMFSIVLFCLDVIFWLRTLYLTMLRYVCAVCSFMTRLLLSCWAYARRTCAQVLPVLCCEVGVCMALLFGMK